jgi:hypothetical protein
MPGLTQSHRLLEEQGLYLGDQLPGETRDRAGVSHLSLLVTKYLSDEEGEGLLCLVV